MKASIYISPGLLNLWRWMKTMGWRFHNIRKTFNLDGHYNTAQMMHRKDMCENYLTEWESRYWFQTTIYT